MKNYCAECPDESYSRCLDDEVAMSEKPYGYNSPPPAADTSNYSAASLNSKKQYSLRNGRAR